MHSTAALAGEARVSGLTRRGEAAHAQWLTSTMMISNRTKRAVLFKSKRVLLRRAKGDDVFEMWSQESQRVLRPMATEKDGM